MSGETEPDFLSGLADLIKGHLDVGFDGEYFCIGCTEGLGTGPKWPEEAHAKHLAVFAQEYLDKQHEDYIAHLQAEMQEARARAWDKGYNLGHHDGQWHMPMRLSGTPLPEKSRRNPYRANPGPEECSRHDTTLARIAENNGEGQG